MQIVAWVERDLKGEKENEWENEKREKDRSIYGIINLEKYVWYRMYKPVDKLPLWISSDKVNLLPGYMISLNIYDG